MTANAISSAISNLSAVEQTTRVAAASEIYRQGRATADQAAFHWWEDSELSGLLLSPKPIVTVGVAVPRETFARIRAANGQPALADVPAEQDAEEFELHFPDDIELDVLTSKEPAGQGAIARFLAKFGEGVQQVEFRCVDVNRAMVILRERFRVAPIYAEARAGANGSKVNFVLVPVADAGVENAKVLIELYELPKKAGHSPLC
jgi:preprotein translocase subunit Sec61beta